VSVRDLAHADLVDELAELLTDRGVAPNQVQLEITEGALMADPRRVLVTLHRLDKLGVALSLDDFGTGYSSLQHLRRLPLAEVKIDRSFVLGMSTDPDDGGRGRLHHRPRPRAGPAGRGRGRRGRRDPPAAEFQWV
jgi:EAL domain-containing protein (putative c-di-GMP-specific phosphodiesterase class I)